MENLPGKHITLLHIHTGSRLCTRREADLDSISYKSENSCNDEQRKEGVGVLEKVLQPLRLVLGRRQFVGAILRQTASCLQNSTQ